MKFVSRAPCRISLIGGGTDVDPFAKKFGGKVLNLAISLYNQAELTPKKSPSINLSALGEKRHLTSVNHIPAYGQDKNFDLVYAVINHFKRHLPSGFDLKLTQTQDSLLGLGRSGSAAVAMIAAFEAWFKKPSSPKQLGLLAANLETKKLGWPGGKQDSLAAAFGGVNLMSFGPGEKTQVSPLKLSQTTISDLKKRTIMVFVGGSRHSADQQKKLIAGMSDQAKLKALFGLKAAVAPAAQALKNKHWPLLGKILHQGWKDKKKTNPAVTTAAIDKIYSLAQAHGAWGGKLSGSGGAGHMFFLLPPQKKSTTVKALTRAGAKEIKFNYDFTGAKTDAT